MGLLASFQNPIGTRGEPRGHSQCKPREEGECRKAGPVCHHITVALFQISRHGVLHGKLGRGDFGEQGELKGGIKEWAGDERQELAMFTTLLHHPVPGQGLGWEGVPLSALQMDKKNPQKTPTKKLSPVPPLGEARGGGWRVHSSLKPEGRRPASILAGRAVDFRRLAASRHRSFPCSTHSCLDFTRVHITVYQRGSIFFPPSFFFFALC